MSEQLQRYIPQGMSRIDRLKEAIRSYWLGPILSSDPRASEFFGGSGSTSTGLQVTESTALNYSAVWSAVQLISSQVGNLPLVLYRKLPGGGKDRFETHPLYRLIHDRPNPETSSLVWRETSQAHVLTWGNTFTEIQRNGAGRPAALWPITPDRVTPFRRSAEAPLQYRVVNHDGGDVFIPAADMIHVPGMGFDGLVGYSVIAKMRESVGLGLAAERFGGTFFGNGASFGGVISYPNAKPPELSDKNYRDSLNAQHQGVDRAHKFLALYNGATYSRIGIPPNDAQFLETRQFQVDEIARWFNLPPHKLKELMRSTNNNIEHQNLEYYIDCLAPWLERWEQELCEKLISPLERNQQEIEFVAEGLLRGDATSRGEFYSKQFSVAGVKPNEIRASENRNPVAGGDDAFVALNVIPLRLSAAYFEASIDAMKAKAEADRRPPPEPAPAPVADPSKQREIELLTEARDLARRVAQEAEDAKDRIAAELAERDRQWAEERAQREQDHAAWTENNATLTAENEALRASMTEQAHTHAEALASVRQQGLDALTAMTAERDTVKGDLVERERITTERHQALETDLADVRAAKASIDMAHQEQVAISTTLQEALDTAGRDLVLAQTERDVAIELQQVIRQEFSDREAQVAEDHRRALEQLEADRADAVARAEQAEENYRFEATQRAEGASREVALQAELTAAAEALQAAVDTHAVWKQTADADRAHEEAVHQATITELRNVIAVNTAALEAKTTALLDATTLLGAADAMRAMDKTALAMAEQVSEESQRERTRLQTRLAATEQALRGVLIETIDRLTVRESDRARKAQGTPEKFAKWAESFYAIHEDFCRQALRPAVRACLVVSGTDLEPDRLLDRILPSYIADSTRAWQGLLQEPDTESFGAGLERVLRRWEAERSDVWADRILKEAQ